MQNLAYNHLFCLEHNWSSRDKGTGLESEDDRLEALADKGLALSFKRSIESLPDMGDGDSSPLGKPVPGQTTASSTSQ